MTTFFQVGTSFQNYAGGIPPPPTADCPATAPYAPNHLMLIVGYDTASRTPYWLIKNSWGVGWGVNRGLLTGGFAKVAMTGVTGGVCGLATSNYYPVSSGSFPTGWATVPGFS